MLQSCCCYCCCYPQKTISSSEMRDGVIPAYVPTPPSVAAHSYHFHSTEFWRFARVGAACWDRCSRIVHSGIGSQILVIFALSSPLSVEPISPQTAAAKRQMNSVSASDKFSKDDSPETASLNGVGLVVERYWRGYLHSQRNSSC